MTQSQPASRAPEPFERLDLAPGKSGTVLVEVPRVVVISIFPTPDTPGIWSGRVEVTRNGARVFTSGIAGGSGAATPKLPAGSYVVKVANDFSSNDRARVDIFLAVAP